MEHLWASWEILGCIWSSWAIVCHLGPTWNILEHFVPPRLLLDRLGSCWPVMGHLGSFASLGAFQTTPRLRRLTTIASRARMSVVFRAAPPPSCGHRRPRMHPPFTHPPSIAQGRALAPPYDPRHRGILTPKRADAQTPNSPDTLAPRQPTVQTPQHPETQDHPQRPNTSNPKHSDS